MNFAVVVLSCLMAAVAAAPQFTRPNLLDRPFVAILRDERQDLGDGAFSYVFEAANGIRESRVGYPGSKGQTNMQGSYRFPLDDGTFAEVRFIADEFGFLAESPLLPFLHPLPAHAVEQIRVAEEQRRRGIQF
ncbi:cuticle protein AM1159-like [Penaeus chinensis]|uniref:cuticle protein AM1159-like n=1 Tax=Penaeus chinensis TaxID=139456 RepID=UPI001FB5FACC|nr:cuticle protein AM1159-like [Penaeus chinensis]